jgi:hypothetical protein
MEFLETAIAALDEQIAEKLKPFARRAELYFCPSVISIAWADLSVQHS